MNKIIAKRSLSEDLVKFEIRTSVARREIKTGQYIILTTEKYKPGIPVAVLKTDSEKETLTVIIHGTDDNSRQLAGLLTGNTLFSIEGPFGYPAKIENFGSVLCLARGSGIVPLLPVLRSLHEAGNHITTILSAETKIGIILENEIQTVSDEMITITDDGSYGEKGSVCQVMGKALGICKMNQVFSIGSAVTIKVSCAHSIKHDIPNQAFIYLKTSDKNPGHGIFRVSLCGAARAVCVDGFNFNAYYPHFEELIKRFGDEEFKLSHPKNAAVRIPV